jgi:hypothetical protein
LFCRNAAGLAVTVYNNILAEQRFSLQLFPHRFSEASAGFYRHFTGFLCNHPAPQLLLNPKF